MTPISITAIHAARSHSRLVAALDILEALDEAVFGPSVDLIEVAAAIYEAALILHRVARGNDPISSQDTSKNKGQ